MVKYTDNISSTNKNGELFNLILLPEYLIFVSRNEETSLHNSSDPFSPDYLFRGGISIVHYCCSRCETVQGCCADGCPKCKKSHTCDSKKDCREKGCTATIYKPDLMKHISELTVSVPVITLFCEQYCQLFAFTSIDRTVDFSSLPSPPSPCPRQKLALHSVFLI